MIPFLVGLLVVSIPVALAWGSALRLVRGLGGIDASMVAEAMAQRKELGRADLEALGQALATTAPRSMAANLVEALRTSVHEDATPLARELALSEAVSDSERALIADARIPRVAASLAASAGLFAAALVMRDGMGGPIVEGVDPVPRLLAVIDRGLSLAALAVLGGVVCAALHRCAQVQRARRLQEIDALAAELGKLARRTGQIP